MNLPRLHLVTSDEVLASPQFQPVARLIVQQFPAALCLHVRARRAGGGHLYEQASRLQQDPAALVFINERVDVALAVSAAGVQLPAGALPVETARALLGPDRWIGRSVHSIEEAVQACDAGADFVLAGTIYPSATHPDGPAHGLGFLAALCTAVNGPVIAIGGIDAQRARACRQAGAYGVAVIGSVWRAADPLSATRGLLQQLEGDAE